MSEKKIIALKGKIISFSPHRRRGMLMVQVKGAEGRLEYQHLQFSDKTYDSSIETHLYTDQIVDVKLHEIKPGKYVVERIDYDVTRHLYKKGMRPYSQGQPRDRSRRDYKRGGRKTKYRSNRENKTVGKEQKIKSRQKDRRAGRPRAKEKNITSNTIQGKDRARSAKGSDNRQLGRSDRGRSERTSKRKRDDRKKRGFRRSRRSQSKFRRRERMRILAIYLHYRRLKQRKKMLLMRAQLRNKQRYRRILHRR